MSLDTVGRILATGVGATLLMDGWAMILKMLGIKPLNFAYLGRWIGHLPRQWFHKPIAQTPPIRGERIIGWCAHYSIGISFSALLAAVNGVEWFLYPTFFPAFLFGIVTVVAPWFLLQPALGLGIASSKTPTPAFNALKSLVTHAIYGVGLFLSTFLTSNLFPRELTTSIAPDPSFIESPQTTSQSDPSMNMNHKPTSGDFHDNRDH